MARTESQVELQSYRANRFDGPQIDEDWVRSVVPRLRRDYSEFQSNCDTAERLVNAKYPVKTSRDMERVRLPILYTSLRASVQHMMAGKVNIGVKNRGQTGAEEDAADQIERFLENTHSALDARYPASEANLFQMGKFGVGIRKVGILNEAIHRLPSFDGFSGDSSEWKKAVEEDMDRRLSLFPFTQEICDPRDVLWDHVSPYPRWVVWERMVPSAWLAANCPDWEHDSDAFGPVRLTEIWTETQFALWANDSFALRPRRHPLGMIPFVFFHEINDDPGRDPTPDSRYQSRMLKSEAMVKMHAQLVSLELAVAQNAAVPITMVVGDGPKVEQLVHMLRANPRKVHQVPSHAQVIHSPVADTPRAIESLVAQFDNALAQMHYTSPMNAIGPGGAQSGYMLSMQSHLMQQNLIGMARAWERGMVRMNEILLRFVERWIRGAVSMLGTTWRGTQQAMVSGRTIKGQYETTCMINADTPEEASRKFQEGMTASQTGWLSTEQSYRHANLENPARRYEERLAEDVVRSEIVTQARAEGYLMAMRERGLGTPQPEPIDEAIEAARALAPMVGNQGPQGNVLGEQRPNTGQFAIGNSAGANANAPGLGLAGTETPYIPQSAQGMDLLRRQQQTLPGDRIRQS